MSAAPEIVVTGRGVVSSIGEGADTFFDALINKKSGIADGTIPLSSVSFFTRSRSAAASASADAMPKYKSFKLILVFIAYLTIRIARSAQGTYLG